MSRDKIKTLSEREQARSKVAIWFGSRDNFIHPFKEVLANSIDEINNNFETGEIIVNLNKSGIITVIDSGRGIPIAGETDGVPNYHLLLLKLFAGTNYDNGENGKISTGTNGVGLTVTNYCSEYFHVKSYKKDHITKITFENGGEITKKIETSKNNTNFTGTEISFRLDKRVFGDYKYDFEEIKDIIKNSAGVNSRINFIVQYDSEKVAEYQYENIEEYFNEITAEKTCDNIIGGAKTFENSFEIHEDVVVSEKDTIELIISTSAEPVQRAYLNITHLKNGGSINDGVIAGVRAFTNKYIKDNKLIDKKLGNVSAGDVEESVSFVCSMLSTVVEFANQTKLATNKALYKTIANKYTQEVLQVELVKNPKNIERLIKHILEVQRFNNKAKSSRASLKKKLSEKADSINNRIDGFYYCKETGENSELFIAEGQSALGSIILARDSKFQAGIAIRGKITNVLKKSVDEILESEIILDIIRALGCGVEVSKKKLIEEFGEFDKSKLNYGKIMIATDMDADGFQIACLLIAVFYKLTPTLVNEGRIYIVNTPLYEVKLIDGTMIYWNSEEEKELYISKFGYTNIKKMARCKGLGEIDADVMAATGVNPETRNVTQVTVSDVRQMKRIMELWLDEDVTLRKERISNELNKYEEIS